MCVPPQTSLWSRTGHRAGRALLKYTWCSSASWCYLNSSGLGVDQSVFPLADLFLSWYFAPGTAYPYICLVFGFMRVLQGFPLFHKTRCILWNILSVLLVSKINETVLFFFLTINLYHKISCSFHSYVNEWLLGTLGTMVEITVLPNAW